MLPLLVLLLFSDNKLDCTTLHYIKVVSNVIFLENLGTFLDEILFKRFQKRPTFPFLQFTRSDGILFACEEGRCVRVFRGP